jgi:hypothetical protein
LTIRGLLRLIAKAKQLGLFEGFDQYIPESLKRRQTKPRKPRKRPVIETPEQAQFSFMPSPRTLAELRAIIRSLNEGELPAAKKDEVTAAMRIALKAHPTNVVAAINAMRKALSRMGFPDDKAKQIAVTEIRTAVNSLLFQYAKNYAKDNGVRLLKRWKHNAHLVNEPRHNHQKLNGVAVPVDEPFTLAGADGITYYPQYPHDGILPAGEVINCQCTYEIIKENKTVKRAEVLKSILHTLHVWKRTRYEIGDVRENPKTDQKEVKRFSGKGENNWVPIETDNAQGSLFDDEDLIPKAKDGLKNQMENLEAFKEKDPEKIEGLVEGIKSLPDEAERIEALKAVQELLTPKKEEPEAEPEPEDKVNEQITESSNEIIDAPDPAAAAESLPKTPETLEAVKTAVDYFVNGGNTKLEVYGGDYGEEAFPDGASEEQKAKINETVNQYKKENKNAKLVWDVRGYLVDAATKPKKILSYTLEDGKEKKILRSMVPDEERVLNYMLTRPNEVKSFFHLVNPTIRRKLFNRFPPADVPELKQRDRLLEIAQKIKSGEYDRAGSDMEEVKDEQIEMFDSVEDSESDNKKRIKKLNQEWQKKRGVEGKEWEVNGRKGHWRLVEADAPTASHNEKTFEQSEDFLHNQDGRTMNDRDYRVETNKEAVKKFAEEFDGRAIAFDDPVTVSPDGIVLSGNNRTMSSKLAAENGTDKAYLDRLQKTADRMGFNPDQLKQFKHPRAIFELEELNEPYSTSLFASFNTDDKKQMDAETAAKKASTILSEKENVVGKIAESFGKYDNVKKLYDDPEAVNDIINNFIDSGVITIADKGKYVSNSGTLTESGQTFVENTLLASVAKPDDLTGLNDSGMASVKNSIMRALPKILKNEAVRKDLSGAIDIMHQAVRNKTSMGDKPDEADIRNAASGGMFEDSKPDSQIELAMKLNGNENDLNRSLGGAESPTPEASPASTEGTSHSAEETAKFNESRIAPIRDKFKAAKRIQGADHSIMLGADELSGKWELVDAETPSASHDEHTFQNTENFPQNELGRNVNDRDYAKDADAQEKVLEYAADYNENALGIDEPVVVSPDGIVLSGNNRTMSSKLAAEKGTDKKYIDALNKRAQSFGFKPEQISQFKHPRVVFRTNDSLPYTTDTFSQFNPKSKKGQNEEETASKVAKVVDNDTADKIAARIRGDTISDFFSDQTSMNSVLDYLVARNAISNTDKNTLVNSNGNVSGEGKVFFKNAFLAMSLGENAMHKIYYNGMNDIRNTVQELSPVIVQSKSLPPDYAIDKEVNEAVDILVDLNRKRKTYPNIEAYTEKNKGANPLSVYLADNIDRQELQPENLSKLIKSLKNSSEGDDMFGDKPTKQEVINSFIERSVNKSRLRDMSIRIIKTWIKLYKIAKSKNAA